MSEPRATVVVITWNRRDEVLATLARLASLPEAPAVVVVDNGSTDGTADAVTAAHPGVRCVRLARNEGATARNAGVALVDTPYVAFCDDDTWWDAGALTRAADVLDACPRLAVVTAHIVVEPDGTDDPICVEIASSELPRPADVPGHPLLSFLAGASMVRRSAFEAAGGFEPRLFLGGEEELLGADLVSTGWAMTYLPDVVIRHRASVARDATERLRLGIRNTMWTTWLRRPLPAALSRTSWMLRRFPLAPVTARGLVAAAAGAPMVAAWRRPVPASVDAGLRTLEVQQRRSTARRYRVAPGGTDPA